MVVMLTMVGCFGQLGGDYFKGEDQTSSANQCLVGCASRLSIDTAKLCSKRETQEGSHSSGCSRCLDFRFVVPDLLNLAKKNRS